MKARGLRTAAAGASLLVAALVLISATDCNRDSSDGTGTSQSSGSGGAFTGRDGNTATLTDTDGARRPTDAAVVDARVTTSCKGAENLAPPSGPPMVLTHHNDNARTGAQLAETILTPSNVKAKGMKLVQSRVVSGEIYGQPLYWTGLDIGGKTRDVTFITTSYGRLFAFDVDDASPAGQLWTRGLVDPIAPTTRKFPGLLGVLSTPVIDGPRKIMYVVYQTTNCFGAATCTGKKDTMNAMNPTDCTKAGIAPADCRPETGLDAAFWIAKIDILTGAVVGTPVMAQGSYTAPNGASATFRANRQWQRPALLLDHGSLWVAYSMRNDEGSHPYHGWVMRYDASTLALQGTFASTPTMARRRIYRNTTDTYWDGGLDEAGDAGEGMVTGGSTGGGSIWMGGGGLAADAAGNVYFTTANGSILRPDMGNSFVKLSPQGDTLVPTAFSPNSGSEAHEVLAQLCDIDLGSGGVALLPGGRVIGGGKEGTIHLVDEDTMSEVRGFQGTCNQYRGRPGYPNLPPYTAYDEGAHLHGSPAVWSWDPGFEMVYVWGEADRLRGYKYDNKTCDLDPAHATCTDSNLAGNVVVEYRIGPPPYPYTDRPNGCQVFASTAKKVMPGGMLSISAKGFTRGTGILWATVPRVEGSNEDGGDTLPKVYAYDAETFEQLWSTTVPKIGHFTPITIASGHVIVATGLSFNVYTLNP